VEAILAVPEPVADRVSASSSRRGQSPAMVRMVSLRMFQAYGKLL
jgi:hypothetical protein